MKIELEGEDFAVLDRLLRNKGARALELLIELFMAAQAPRRASRAIITPGIPEQKNA